MSSSEYAVRIEDLGKRYVVPNQEGANQRGRFRAHLKTFLPFLRHHDDDYFWALRDISLDIKQGEVLGILGRNGSGKSTLLKILSRVTLPTKGRAVMQGRVGSLLEVGTGFHPDLSGRENVFMSGVLLGLDRHFIAGKFDEILEFSGIGQFIDVPVKQYSSGMYVRLAYAVASLLSSDILILDEVMAVADLSFQEKTSENIKRLTSSGRTILFVSHNIELMRRLCTRGVLLERGRLSHDGPIDEVADEYQRDIYKLRSLEHEDFTADAYRDVTHLAGLGDKPRTQPGIRWISTQNGEGVPTRNFRTGEAIRISIGYQVDLPAENIYLSVFFIDDRGNRICVCHSMHDANLKINSSAGVVHCEIHDLRLYGGVFSVAADIGFVAPSGPISCDWLPACTSIKVSLGNYLGPYGLIHNQGFFAQKSRWTCAG